MLVTKRKEEEEAILSHPQPLRDLIRVDRHPNDSNLNHLSTAIQAIRDNPDPKLFKQLVMKLDDGSLKLHSLLTLIVLNEYDLLTLKPWGEKEEAIAIGACIDALPLTKGYSRKDLIVILLRAFGGGEIKFEGSNGGSRVAVTIKKNGYEVAYGRASSPLSLEDAQQELRRLYRKSKEKLGDK